MEPFGASAYGIGPTTGSNVDRETETALLRQASKAVC